MIEREQLIAMVRGLQNGEEQAAIQFYETCKDDIYYFILKTVNNDWELAEDLTHDTFIEILTTIDKLHEPAAFVTWSRQIAYHKCTAYFRKRKELLVDENEEGLSPFDTLEEENIEFIPDAALDQEDLKQTILKMINELPEEQKSAIILRYFNEISVKEIAEIQGVTEGTVKSRLNYGRKSIKQAVEEFEKKNGVRLHCVGVLPLLLWLFKNYRVENNLHMSSQTAMQSFVIGEKVSAGAAMFGTSSGSAAVSAAATTTTSATAATAAVAKTATGLGLKLAGKAITTKLIACVAAAAVAVGGTAVGVATLSEPQPTEILQETTRESWAAETTAPFVIEETTQPPTEETAVPTEETAVPTEETTVPSEEAVTEIKTPAATESPTEAPTEAPAATECEHDWSYYSVSYDLDDVPEYEDRTCLKCGEVEILYEAKYTGCNNHQYVVGLTVGYDVIHETRVCNICGKIEQTASYPNTCPHDITYYTEQINTMLYTYERCSLCGYDKLISTEEITCKHDWVYDSFERDGQLYEVQDCSKCNAHEVISVTDIVTETEPIHYHAWEVVEVIEVTPEDLDVQIVCRDCGAETISDWQEFYGEEPTEEVPSEGTEETPTEGAEDSEAVESYGFCSTCGCNFGTVLINGQCEYCRNGVCHMCGGPISENHSCDDYPNLFCPNPDCGWSIFTTGVGVFGYFCPICGEQCA